MIVLPLELKIKVKPSGQTVWRKSVTWLVSGGQRELRTASMCWWFSRQFLILYLLAFGMDFSSGAKLKSWLGRNIFVGGVEPDGRYFGQLAEVNGFLYLFGGLHGSGEKDSIGNR